MGFKKKNLSGGCLSYHKLGENQNPNLLCQLVGIASQLQDLKTIKKVMQDTHYRLC